MSDYHHLFSPLEIGPMQVRNRVLISAHVPGFAENNKPGKQYIAYHQNYARNGVGLQITGGTPVHESGLLSTSSDGLWNLDDSIIPGYQAFERGSPPRRRPNSCPACTQWRYGINWAARARELVSICGALGN
ncbi:hypothetical protein ACMAZH_03660 [Arenicellales bacterium nBUS_45]